MKRLAYHQPLEKPENIARAIPGYPCEFAAVPAVFNR